MKDTKMRTTLNRRRWLQGAAAAAAAPLLVGPFPALAQDRFPRDRPVSLVCPWAPGGIADTTSRRMAQGLSATWGSQVIVDNRAGANGNIGAAYVARATPDGYTLLLTLHDGMVVGKAAGFRMGFDPLIDLTAIAQIGISDIYWTVRGDAPYKNINEFVAYAKAHPGTLNFGSNGIGSSPHLAMELLNNAAGINITHVPFRGGSQAIPELLAGRLDAFMATPQLALEQFRAGALRPIALVGSQRSPLFPGIATIAESGYPDVSISIGVGIFGPKGMARPLVDQINQEVRAFVNAPEMKAKFIAEGFPPSDISAPDYQAFLAREVTRMVPLVKRVNLQQA
jgi:tripartite-type tricarboxylate transporter receptor subunit TctC